MECAPLLNNKQSSSKLICRALIALHATPFNVGCLMGPFVALPYDLLNFRPNCGASSNLGGLPFIRTVVFVATGVPFARFVGERAIWEYLVAFFGVSAC